MTSVTKVATVVPVLPSLRRVTNSVPKGREV